MWALTTVTLQAAEDAGEWTRFRGPNGTGISSATNLPSAWTDKDYRWKATLPGVGHASPVIWSDRAFVLCSDKTNAVRIVVCLNTSDGSIAWRREFPSATFPKNRDNGYATSTPAVDANRVYVYWTTRDEVTVVALDHGGKDVWRVNLGPFKSQHGSGASLIVVDDLVLVNNDQDGPSFLTALDATSGASRWRLERRADRAAYATPCVRQTPEGQTEAIFASSALGITAVDLRSGTVNWELTNAFPFRVVGSPVLGENLVIGACGEGGVGRRLVAVKPGSRTRPAELAYEFKSSIPYVPTPVLKDGRLFLWGDNGLVVCHRVATGERLWQHKISDSFYSSPVWAADRLYGVSKRGVVYVLAAGETPELISSIPLGEPSFATPAIADGALFFRTESHLFCLGAK
ncbi:MAG TPA: PQQ-binding-like beta-propeller repeat protein [Verrucomicrobiae bacterium]